MAGRTDQPDPGLSICHSEGTYLGWIDARETGLSDPAFYERSRCEI